MLTHGTAGLLRHIRAQRLQLFGTPVKLRERAGALACQPVNGLGRGVFTRCAV
ncbi:hypothetical protein ACS15_5441 [Ralstonia insidiosa]|uniref:Uncharacterized protein n=1 Tax=Ralstonia insidiosa TaxID=190721 RepID=A0AAC9BMJ4_9RALS|nr:hypothetical protein ACS15_5441 [Ralstonia insidiosa]